jgi:hypothetical protein
MPVTLAQAQLDMQDDIQRGVIDSLRKSSFLLDNMLFDMCVTPGTGGGTLTYGYNRLLAQRGAAQRDINADYVPTEATKQQITVALGIFGGSYQIDRVIAGVTGNALVDEMAFQIDQATKALSGKINDVTINGTTGSEGFDGLSAALTGGVTEFNTDSVIDMSTAANINTNWKSVRFLINKAIGSLAGGMPSFIGTNIDGKAMLVAMAQEAGSYTVTLDDFGRMIERYNGIPIIDLGEIAGSSTEYVVPNANITIGGTPYTGVTDFFMPRLGIDAFHAVTPAGLPGGLIRNILPDFTSSGAVKTGEIETVMAPVLKNVRGASVVRNVKVV